MPIPDFLANLFTSRRKPQTPPPATQNGRLVSTSPGPFNKPGQPPVLPTNQPAPQRQANGLERFLGNLLGFQPKDGFRGDGAEGAGNAIRAFVGLGNNQANNEPFRDLLDREAARTAAANNDLSGLAQLDPKRALSIAGATDALSSREAEARDLAAIEAGDFDAIANSQTQTATAFRQQQAQAEAARETQRQQGALRALDAASVISGGDPAAASQVLQQFAQDTPGLFTQQELDVANQGGIDAVKALLGQKAERAKLLNVSEGSSVFDPSTGEFKTAPVREKELTDVDRSIIDLNNARAQALLRKAEKDASRSGKPEAGAVSELGRRNFELVFDELDTILEDAKGTGFLVDNDLKKEDNIAALAFLEPAGKIAAAGSIGQQTRDRLEALADTAARQYIVAYNVGATSANTEKEYERIRGIFYNPKASIQANKQQLEFMRGLILGGVPPSEINLAPPPDAIDPNAQQQGAQQQPTPLSDVARSILEGG